MGYKLKTSICIRCGIEITGGDRKLVCDECRSIYYREADRERYRKNRIHNCEVAKERYERNHEQSVCKYCGQTYIISSYASNGYCNARCEIATGMQKCQRCNTIKPLGEFCRSAAKSSGYNCYCKECRAKEFTEYASRPEVKERRRKRNREYSRTEKAQERILKYRDGYLERRRIVDAKRRKDPTFKINVNMKKGIKIIDYGNL